MTKSQSEEAAKDMRVAFVKESIEEWEECYHIPARGLPPLVSPEAHLSNALPKRAAVYSTQANAVSELVAVSQPR